MSAAWPVLPRTAREARAVAAAPRPSDGRPVLSWRLGGGTQHAWQLRWWPLESADRGRKAPKSRAIRGFSCWKPSRSTAGHRWPGPRLCAGERYGFQVWLRGPGTVPGSWSAAAAVEAPLLEEADWGGSRWIGSRAPWGRRPRLRERDLGGWIRPGRRPGGAFPVERLALRFDLPALTDRPVTFARVRLAVSDPRTGEAELKCNDSRLPNFAYRTHRAGTPGGPWQTVEGDALAFLRPGENLWWLEIRGDTAVSLRLELRYADGGTRSLVTGPRWRWLRDGVPVELRDTPPSRGSGAETLAEDHGPRIDALWPDAVPAEPAPARDRLPRTIVPRSHGPHRFTRRVRLEEAAAGGRVYLLARGFARVFLDGRELGPGAERLLDPVPANTDLLHWQVVLGVPPLDAGEHELGVVLAGGWPGQDRVWVGGLPGLHADPRGIAAGRPAFRLAMRLDTAEGPAWVGSTRHWGCRAARVAAANLYAGESHVDPPTDDPGVVEVPDAAAGAFPLQPIPACRREEAFPAVRVTEPGPGLLVVDFGRNLSGQVDLRVDTPGPAAVRVRHGERLDADGRVDALSTGVRATRVEQVLVVAVHGGIARLRPAFTTQGFRYAEVSGLPSRAALLDAEAHRVHTPVGDTGSFACSHPTLNALQAAAEATYLDNLQGVLTDCPHRERGGWHADIEAACAFGLQRFDTAAVYRKTLADTLSSLGPDGLPMYLGVGRRLHPPAADIGWATLVAEVPALLFAFTGDRGVIAGLRPHARRVADAALAQRASDGLLHGATFGDHAAPLEDAHGRSVPPLPHDLYATLKLIELLGTLADMGDTRARRQRSAVARDLAEARCGPAGYGHPVADAWALLLGAHPPEAGLRLLASLRAALAAGGGVNPGGFFGHARVLRALFEHGSAAEAVALLTNDVFPSLAFSVLRDGHTTLPEYLHRPGTLAHRERSMNHPPFAGAIGFLTSHLSGLGVTAPPRDLVLAPRPDAGLEHVEAAVTIGTGRFASTLVTESDAADLRVSVPGGRHARLRLPAGWSAAGARVPARLSPGSHRLRLVRPRARVV